MAKKVIPALVLGTVGIMRWYPVVVQHLGTYNGCLQVCLPFKKEKIQTFLDAVLGILARNSITQRRIIIACPKDANQAEREFAAQLECALKVAFTDATIEIAGMYE